MFIGHFGLALASKKINTLTSLGTAFLAAQFVDLLWPFFLLLGIEKVEIDPGNTAFTSLNFVSYPYSHSLVAAFVWAAIFGSIYFAYRRNRNVAIILALLVFSHWILDYVTHRADLPISFSEDTKVGLGLWNNRAATIIVELIIFLGGTLLYWQSTRPKNRTGSYSFFSLILFFIIIYVMNVFGDPPPNAEVIGYVGWAQWLFIFWGYWVDRNRTSKESSRPVQIG